MKISILSRNLISFGKLFVATGQHTANRGFPRVPCFELETLRTHASLDLPPGIVISFSWYEYILDVAGSLVVKSFEDDRKPMGVMSTRVCDNFCHIEKNVYDVLENDLQA